MCVGVYICVCWCVSICSFDLPYIALTYPVLPCVHPHPQEAPDAEDSSVVPLARDDVDSWFQAAARQALRDRFVTGAF